MSASRRTPCHLCPSSSAAGQQLTSSASSWRHAQFLAHCCRQPGPNTSSTEDTNCTSVTYTAKTSCPAWAEATQYAPAPAKVKQTSTTTKVISQTRNYVQKSICRETVFTPIAYPWTFHNGQLLIITRQLSHWIAEATDHCHIETLANWYAINYTTTVTKAYGTLCNWFYVLSATTKYIYIYIYIYIYRRPQSGDKLTTEYKHKIIRHETLYCTTQTRTTWSSIWWQNRIYPFFGLKSQPCAISCLYMRQIFSGLKYLWHKSSTVWEELTSPSIHYRSLWKCVISSNYFQRQWQPNEKTTDKTQNYTNTKWP